MFGLTSIDGLISILLIETGWWSKEFLETILPNALNSGIGSFEDVHFMGFCIVFFLKFLAQGFLWLAFLRNYTGRCQLIRGWYWLGFGLDLAFTALVLSSSSKLPDLSYNFNEKLILLAQLIVFRGSIWGVATVLIRSISNEDVILFSDGFVAHILDQKRAGSTVIIIMGWECVWFTLIAFTTGLLREHSEYNGTIVPISMAYSPLILTLHVAAVLGALFQWIGITQNFKLFLKFWLSVYIIFNVFGYALVSFLDISHDYFNFSGLAAVASGGAKLVLPVFPMGLKIGAVIGLIIFLGQSETSPETPPGKNQTGETKPLVTWRN